MRKPRSNSHWNQLSGPQRETVEKWLFDEHLSYDETLARVKTEFGLEASRTSLFRYYQQRVRERQITELVEAQAMADKFAAPNLNTDSMRAAALKIIAKTALKLACERPDQLKELESLTKLLLVSEDNDIRRGRLKLEQAQFHYEDATAASKELPHLATLLLKIDDDDDLSEAAKLAKVHALLFPGSARVELNKADQTQPGNGG